MEFDFDIWYNTPDPDFVDINIKSRVPEKWMAFSYVTSDPKWKNSVIKPINGYVKNFGVMPRLISINSNIVRLRQDNYAEIFILEKDDEVITRDRPWMRQYYNTSKSFSASAEAYSDTYALFVPWFIDADVTINIEQSEEWSPFEISPQTISSNKINSSQEFVGSPMIPFHFKKVGKHVVEPGYGRIKLGSPLFDLVFTASDELVNEIRKVYEEN